ncbi:hypothetical protein SAMN05216229_11344 [Geopseudomonas sagittaria]|uniref:Lipoprotein n=1 Tax=Geopseudomonas sagittaria TaxID=1135990 RepID=A0A1I5WE04_9GAMM|nr:DUF3299 domain-containing protein [Pseudomonas sagittaria]SFQ17871.1 hypothetical protein SAMN05216229_11344 [Pseudomonas sagittaria]
MLRALLLALALLATPVLAAEPRILSWEEMIPEGAPPPPPPIAFHDLSRLADALAAEGAPAATQQSPAAPVVEALHGQRVRIPGYVVPLDMDEAGRVREFLLVPYYGACIHVPPPPSNQIVHVHTATPLQLDELWQPFWIAGELRVEASSSELAEAGYRMQAEHIRPYELPHG